LTPIAALSGSAKVMGQAFPSTYFQQISIGAFTKALGLADLAIHMAALGALMIGYLVVARALLKTQEG
jgi:ribosome-dependent ATPase